MIQTLGLEESLMAREAIRDMYCKGVGFPEEIKGFMNYVIADNYMVAMARWKKASGIGISYEEVARLVCTIMQLDYDEFLGKASKEELSMGRHLYVWACGKLKGKRSLDGAMMFICRDRNNQYNSLQRIEDVLVTRDVKYIDAVLRVESVVCEGGW